MVTQSPLRKREIMSFHQQPSNISTMSFTFVYVTEKSKKNLELFMLKLLTILVKSSRSVSRKYDIYLSTIQPFFLLLQFSGRRCSVDSF